MVQFFFEILPGGGGGLTLLSFKVPSERFFHKVFKTGITLCGFKNCKIESEFVNILVGHSV